METEPQNISKEIILMREEDQRVRSGIVDFADMTEEEKERMRDVDSKNFKRIKEIVEEHGCITISKYGDKASQSAFLLIQHSPEDEVDFMERYLQLMEDNLDDVNITDYAYLFDRTRMYRGKPQVYGSQLKINFETGKAELYEIENFASVDERRKEVGLEPLEKYLTKFNI